MNKEQIIKVLKEDIKEIKKDGFKDISLIKGLSFNNCFEVCLMVGINEGNGLGSCFKKTYRTIQYKSDFSRNEFLIYALKELNEVLNLRNGN